MMSHNRTRQDDHSHNHKQSIIPITITLCNNMVYLMLGLAGVILGWRGLFWGGGGYFHNSQTHTQSEFGHGSAGSCRAQRQARRRPSEAIGTRRGSERTINAPFLEGGLGVRAVGTNTSDFGSFQRLVPKPPSTGC